MPWYVEYSHLLAPSLPGTTKELTNVNVTQDHIVQWHPTILAKLALIPQRMLNSYSPDSPHPGSNGVYKEGDFLVRMAGCETTSKRDCEKELEPYWEKWAKDVLGKS